MSRLGHAGRDPLVLADCPQLVAPTRQRERAAEQRLEPSVEGGGNCGFRVVTAEDAESSVAHDDRGRAFRVKVGLRDQDAQLGGVAPACQVLQDFFVPVERSAHHLAVRSRRDQSQKPLASSHPLGRAKVGRGGQQAVEFVEPGIVDGRIVEFRHVKTDGVPTGSFGTGVARTSKR